MPSPRGQTPSETPAHPPQPTADRPKLWGSLALAAGLFLAACYQRSVEGIQTELLALGILLAPALLCPWALRETRTRCVELAQVLGLVALLGVRGRGAEVWAIHLAACSSLVSALAATKTSHSPPKLLTWLSRLSALATLTSMACLYRAENTFASARLLVFLPFLLEAASRRRETPPDHWRRLAVCLAILGLDSLVWIREWHGGMALLVSATAGAAAVMGCLRLYLGVPRFRRLAFSLTAFGLALLLAWTLGELGFRWLPNSYRNINVPEERDHFHEPHETFTYRGGNFGQKVGYENVVRWNSYGLWDVDHELGVAPLTSRVLVVGDSFVEGVQVGLEDLLHRRLGRGLSEQSGQAYEAISYACSGWGQVAALRALEVGGQVLPDLGPALPPGFDYAPDLIVAEFLPGNDVYDNFPELAQTTRDEWQDSSFARRWYYLVLQERLYFSAMLLDKLDLALRRLWGEQDSIVMDVYQETPPRYPQMWAEAWKRTEAAFADLAQSCNRRDIRLVVVVFPSFSETTADLSYPAKRAAGICAAIGLECLDLTPAFVAHPNSPELFVEHDGHWSAAGHALAADEILRYLGEHPRAPSR